MSEGFAIEREKRMLKKERREGEEGRGREEGKGRGGCNTGFQSRAKGTAVLRVRLYQGV